MRLIASVFHGFQRNGVMIELKSGWIIELVWRRMVINGRWKDCRLAKRFPIGTCMPFELDFTRRKHVRPSSPIVCLLSQYLIFIFLPEGI